MKGLGSGMHIHYRAGVEENSAKNWNKGGQNANRSQEGEKRSTSPLPSFQPVWSLVQSLSRVQLFVTPWTAALQSSLSFTISQSLLKFVSIESVMPSHHLILHRPLLLLPSIFLSIRGFPRSQFFASGGQNTGSSASASVLPMNIQDWSPLGLTGLTSLLSKGLTRVFSNTTVQSISYSALRLLYGQTLTSTHDYWKNHSFDYMDLCRQSNVSAFWYAV